MSIARSEFRRCGKVTYVVRSALRCKNTVCIDKIRLTTVYHVPSWSHRFYKNCSIRTC